VEGVADKVTGIQGLQTRLSSDLKGVRVEQKQHQDTVATNATVVGDQLRSLFTTLDDLQHSVPPPHMAAFAPHMVRCEENAGTSRTGLDLVVLKHGTAAVSGHPAVVSSAAFATAPAVSPRYPASGRLTTVPSPRSRAAAAQPAVCTATVGDFACCSADGAADVSHPEERPPPASARVLRGTAAHVGLTMPGMTADFASVRPPPLRPGTAGVRTELERRNLHLHEKRRELVDSRLKGGDAERREAERRREILLLQKAPEPRHLGALGAVGAHRAETRS